ncbi:MAG: M48 family metalloprotease [Azovibrio sp.]|uniref:M48 family metalloprotease n=1 Tax=Azovibrio sp. TaxID=1872673 RepID=UPI003C7833B8
MKQSRTFRPLAASLALIATFGLSGCKNLDVNSALQQGGNLARSFNHTVGPQEERRMGEESAALLLGAAPLVKSPGVQRYVNQVGQWIALQTGRSDIQWHFGVLDTSNVNAFAAPAGYVFVTRGQLQRLQDESELAGIIAHEISHVLMGHYVQTMLKKDRVAALGNLANTVAQSQGKEELGALVNLTRGIYSAGLDKEDEYQADRMGVVLAARAGYDPFGLPRVLQMYAANAGQAGFDLLFSTHPSADDRLDKLASAMADKFDALESKSIKNTTAFSRQIASLGPTPKPR